MERRIKRVIKMIGLVIRWKKRMLRINGERGMRRGEDGEGIGKGWRDEEEEGREKGWEEIELLGKWNRKIKWCWNGFKKIGGEW